MAVEPNSSNDMLYETKYLLLNKELLLLYSLLLSLELVLSSLNLC